MAPLLVNGLNLDQIEDEKQLNELVNSSQDPEMRKAIEARLRQVKSLAAAAAQGAAGDISSTPVKRSPVQGRPTNPKDALLHWCYMKTRSYDNVYIENFSSSWADGLAFCALLHHFFPDAIDYSKLSNQNRRENFDLAFKVAEEKAKVFPLLETSDMIKMGDKPDWKCVYTYVQALFRGLKPFDPTQK